MPGEHGFAIAPNPELVPLCPGDQPTSRFQRVFGVGPVALATIEVRSATQTSRDMERVLRAGYQGAFLASGRLRPSELAGRVRGIASSFRGTWIGVRFAGVPTAEELDLVIDHTPNAWICDMEQEEQCRWIGHEWEHIRCLEQGEGLLFGTLPATDEDDPGAAAVCLSRFVDVVVEQVTGNTPATLQRLREIKHALGGFPLAAAGHDRTIKTAGLAKTSECLISVARCL